jgi:hypothetical protein
MSSDDGLVRALRDLVAAAPAALESIDDPVGHIEGVEDWRADPADPTHFRRTTSQAPWLRFPARAAMEGTSQWQAAMRALRADAVLGDVVDRLVGTVLGSGLVQGEFMLHWVIARALLADEPDPELQAAVAELRLSHGATHADITTTVIVGGCSAAAAMPISENVVVRSMSDPEVANALRVGAMPILGPLGPSVFVHDRTCVAITEALPRVIGPTEDISVAAAIFADRQARIETALATLRLVGLTALQEYAQITMDGRGGTAWGARRAGPVHGPDTAFDADSATEARRVFPLVLGALRQQTPLAIAIRRYSSSHDPKHEEDRLLDLWIAVEALFGTDDPGETTFRVALNLANSVEHPGITRRAMFEWVKHSDNVRSRLVHGRGVTPGKLSESPAPRRRPSPRWRTTSSPSSARRSS